MLWLLVVLRMLGPNITHIMLLVMVLIMVAMVLSGVEMVDNLLVMTTWLGLRLRMLLGELYLYHSTWAGVVNHVDAWAWVVISRSRGVV